MTTSNSVPLALVQPAAPGLLQRVTPGRALRGFGNLLGNETRVWWGTRKWLVHLLIWIAIINGFAGLIGWAEGQDGEAASEVYGEVLQVFFIVLVAKSCIRDSPAQHMRASPFGTSWYVA